MKTGKPAQPGPSQMLNNQPELRLNRLPTQFQCEGTVIYSISRWKVRWSRALNAQRLTDSFNLLVDKTGSPFPKWEPPNQNFFSGQLLNQKCLDLLRVLQSVKNLYLAQWLLGAPAYAIEDEIGCAFLDEFFADLLMPSLHVLPKLFGLTESPVSQKQINSTLFAIAKKLEPLAPLKSSVRILIEAQRRGIPTVRLSEFIPVYQLGHGCHQKRLWNGFTSQSTYMATVLSTHKHIASKLMQNHGLPIPSSFVANNVREALNWAHKAGYPVVIKPTSKDMGIGVTADIQDDSELERAFNKAKAYGAVLVEKYIPGEKYRLFVLDGECIGAYCTVPAHVVGDGKLSIVELMRRKSIERALDPDLSESAFPDPDGFESKEYLFKSGLTPNHVPKSGEFIRLSSPANVRAGGERKFLNLEKIHPDNIQIAEIAAKLFEIDVAGVDFITRDISRSWSETGGAINEINVNPALPFPDVPGRLLDYLFPNKWSGRIHLVVLIGDLTQSQESRVIREFFAREASRERGCLLNRKLYLNRHEINLGRGDLKKQIRLLLSNRFVSRVFLHLSLADFRAFGMPTSYLSKLILNLSEEDEKMVLSDPAIVGLCSQMDAAPLLRDFVLADVLKE